jgi:hypothetical protein
MNWPGWLEQLVVCEFVDEEFLSCGEPAAARVTSRVTGDHMWCCVPHRESMLQSYPGDAYVSAAGDRPPAGQGVPGAGAPRARRLVCPL